MQGRGKGVKSREGGGGQIGPKVGEGGLELRLCSFLVSGEKCVGRGMIAPLPTFLYIFVLLPPFKVEGHGICAPPFPTPLR